MIVETHRSPDFAEPNISQSVDLLFVEVSKVTDVNIKHTERWYM